MPTNMKRLMTMSKKPRPTPTYRSPSGRFITYWKVVADARRSPGEWFAIEYAAPRATYKAIRAGYHRDLQVVDGVIEAEWRNEHVSEVGVRGDVFVRFVPNQKEQP